MDEEVREIIFAQAKEWILEAGKNIRNKINEPLTIDTKTNENDLVTEMDKETEKFFADNIQKKYPSHLLLGEEGYGDDVTSLDGTVWIIDPIDGTKNFVHLKKQFAISVGIFHNEVGEIGFIYDVMADELYSAKRGEGAFKNDEQLKQLNPEVQLENSIIALNHNLLCTGNKLNPEVVRDLVKTVRGTRIIGAAALDIAYVADGIIDGFISKGLSPWDIAAGVIILNEVSSSITRSDGSKINILDYGTVLACNPVIQKRIISEYLINWEQ